MTIREKIIERRMMDEAENIRGAGVRRVGRKGRRKNEDSGLE